jgi:hypothetical protein
MRIKYLWLAFALTLVVALAWSDDGDAQPGKKGPFGKKGFRKAVTADQLVERILSFDKNEDGKITADELPERMQHLVAMGDINKDGALDRGEITKLATTLEAFTALTGGGPGDGPPKGPFGKGKGGPKGLPKGPAGEARRALDDMDLNGATRDQADRVLRASQEKQKRFDEVVRAEILLEMKGILKEEDFVVFKESMDRPPGPGGAFKKKGPPPSGSMGGRIDQLQKDLEEMRRKLVK